MWPVAERVISSGPTSAASVSGSEGRLGTSKDHGPPNTTYSRPALPTSGAPDTPGARGDEKGSSSGHATSSVGTRGSTASWIVRHEG